MGLRLDSLTTVEVLPLTTRTTTGTGAAVDVRQYVGKIGITQMSAAGSTADTMDTTIENSADGSTGWAAISGAAFTQVTDAADAHETIYISADSCLGYIRAVATIAGTTPSFDSGVSMFGAQQNR